MRDGPWKEQQVGSKPPSKQSKQKPFSQGIGKRNKSAKILVTKNFGLGSARGTSPECTSEYPAKFDRLQLYLMLAEKIPLLLLLFALLLKRSWWLILKVDLIAWGFPHHSHQDF